MNNGRSSKKLVNNVDRCVDDSLAGLVAANDGLLLIAEHRIIVRADYDDHVRVNRKVALVSGGGSGHEPVFAGFVGEGLLTAAVAGSIFASPPSTNVLAALRLIGKGNTEGTLVIVANYTGDRLSFGLAVERAKSEGQQIEMVLVADDCALVSDNKAVGRRGLCGISLIMKIAGSMAEKGFALEDIASKLRSLSPDLGTVGMCLSPCSLPGMKPTFNLGDNEMELGLGVHGEAGIARMETKSAKDTLDILLKHMTKEENCSRLKLTAGVRVALLLNNLGGTTQLEMNIATYEAINWLENRDVIVERIIVAPMMTSLEMAGISVTVLKVDDSLLEHIDAETTAPGWPRNYQKKESKGRRQLKRIESSRLFNDVSIGNKVVDNSHDQFVFVAEFNENDASRFRKSLEAASQHLIDNRLLLNELDSGCGDGDCGNTMASGAEKLLESLSNGSIDVRRPLLALNRLSEICQLSMGGTSGALYGILFAAMANTFLHESSSASSIDAWRLAFVNGFEGIVKYGGAEPGDRTMLDALHSLITAWPKCAGVGISVLELVIPIVTAVREGAFSTSNMVAKAGRASYVNASHWGKPDAGAVAVALIVEAIATCLQNYD